MREKKHKKGRVELNGERAGIREVKRGRKSRARNVTSDPEKDPGKIQGVKHTRQTCKKVG